MTADVVRSYSPTRAIRSVPQETKTSGATAFTISRTRCSLPGFLTDHSNDTAIASAPSSRSEEHTSELQSRGHLVCRLLLEKKKKNKQNHTVVTKKKNK